MCNFLWIFLLKKAFRSSLTQTPENSLVLTGMKAFSIFSKWIFRFFQLKYNIMSKINIFFHVKNKTIGSHLGQTQT